LDVPPSMGEWVEYFDSLLEEKKFQKCKAYPSKIEHVRFQDRDCIACRIDTLKSQLAKPSSSVLSHNKNSQQAIQASSSSGIHLSKSSAQTATQAQTGGYNSLKFWVALVILLIVFLIIVAYNQPSHKALENVGKSTPTMPGSNGGGQISRHQAAILELSKKEFFGRYSINCNLPSTDSDYSVISLARLGDNMVRFSAVGQQGSSDGWLEVISFDYNNSSMYLNGWLVGIENSAERAEVEFEIINDLFRVWRHVDTVNNIAIVLNGFSLKSETQTKVHKKCK